MTDIADMTAVEMTGALRSRSISTVEAVQAVLDRIDSRSRLNAFMTVSSERALDEAHAVDSATAKGEEGGLLKGLPFSVKDLTNTEGVRTTSGSALFANNVPSTDAVAVSRARAAGAIMIGKTTTPEFGHKPFTEGPYFGRTLNPWNERVTCGGSSGGAAVAIAAGMGPLALGTDGGGSIRIPASCCGVVGFKATLGAIPNLQAADLFGANSYVGPMARTVGDTRLMFEAMRGPDVRDPFGQTVGTLRPRDRAPVRIGWLASCGNVLDPEVGELTAAAGKLACDLGMRIEPVEIDFVGLEEAFLVILRSTLLSRLEKAASSQPQLLDPTLIATIDAGRAYTAADLVAAQAMRTDYFARIQQIFLQVDIIASATLSAPPLPVHTDPLGRIEIAGRDAGTIRGAWYPYTYPYNLTGHPAITIPCGLTRAGLPVGFHLAGRWHDDDRLLDIAEAFEEAIDFRIRPGFASSHRHG